MQVSFAALCYSLISQLAQGCIDIWTEKFTFMHETDKGRIVIVQAFHASDLKANQEAKSVGKLIYWQ